MMKAKVFMLATSVLMPIFLAAQIAGPSSYIDSLSTMEPISFAYKVDQAPTIDGDESEWLDIPWSEAYWNDRDFNGDNVIDPMSARNDYRARWKAAWIDGSNEIYFLFETFDDEIFVTDDKASHRDNVSIRLDPYDEQLSMEPMQGTGKHSFNIRFQIDSGENTHFEGYAENKPPYEAAVVVDDSKFPIHTILEIYLALPVDIILEDGFGMGYWPLWADNDREDDSPSGKNTVPVIWPQLYNDMAAGKIRVDDFWRDDYYWGNIVCVDPTIHVVSGGGTGVIQSVIDAAEEGDIIKVGAGEYYENLVIDKPWIQLISTADMTAGDTTKIIPDLVADPALLLPSDNLNRGVVVQGFLFDGLWLDGDTAKCATQGVENYAPELKLLGNIVRNFDSPIDNYAGNVVVEDNIVLHGNDGIRMHGHGNCVVRYNIVDKIFGGYGVDHKGLSDGEIADIAFNRISDIRQCGIGWGGDGGIFTIHHNYIYRSFEQQTIGEREMDDGIENQESTASTSYIYNNTIVGWNSDGMQLNGPSTYYVRNNLIAEEGENRDFDLRNTESINYDIAYNLSWNSNGDAMMATEYDGANSINTDPMFVDALVDDYTLQAFSPAINAGKYEPFGFKTHYAIPADGWDGTNASRPDMGAFEYGFDITSINDNQAAIINRFGLEQNYPNPFNPSTTIRFNLASAEHVTLKVYNVIGQEIATLVDGKRVAGEHTVELNASYYSSGIYFYTLKANGKVQTKKMILIK